MKYTVFYKTDGTVVSIASEQADIENIRIGTFEVPDGNVIDSIDTSKKEHVAVSHATPMTNAAELAAVKKQAELNSAGIAELTDVVMNGGSKA
ncbi:hypothetical protein [Lachnoanaerobaculum saburreum]|uniref:Uncharacterized protein n=1 Tax=Lachnoanaerobaculum saburreum DSM 3986 TaxID=887325 RepID=E6LJC7_9FIRM|nr:hypothetical protein [Lachnoanaerobaculum saburreum]EFU78061.1 hypothetical protein HMPREF0381_0062 [Lachnoanaerobaculum saburreum DSM 3986]